MGSILDPKALTVAGLDAATTANINNPSSSTRSALSGNYLKLGHSDYYGTAGPMIELATSPGSGRIFHLLSGEGSTSEIAGIGVDHDGSQGFTFSVKANNGIGVGVNLETTSGPASYGYLGALFAQGTAMELRKGSQNGGTLLSLRADYGGTGTLLSWGNAAGSSKGRISETGDLTMTGSQLIVQSANTAQSLVRTSVAAGGTQAAHYVYSGTPGLWFPNAVSTYGNSMVFQQGNAAAIGGETMSTLIELKNTNAIGFYGVTPVTRAAAIASPASDTSGTKAAIDAIRAALTNIGITA